MSYVFDGIDGYLRESVSTGMPGIIVSVAEYGDKQFVDVKPALSRVLETGQVISNDEITIYDVPVIWPSAGGGLLSFPIKVGDTVWLSFSQRNLEDWLYSDGTQEVIPGDSRHFSMTDAVAEPGLYTALSNLKPSTENVEIKFGNHLISLRPSGELYITNGGAEIKLNPSGTITANGATITPDGNVITANGTNLDQFYADYLAHVHPAKPPSSPSDFSDPPV
jgi:hypothetical protein